jgi:hypothetical protein
VAEAQAKGVESLGHWRIVHRRKFIAQWLQAQVQQALKSILATALTCQSKINQFTTLF